MKHAILDNNVVVEIVDISEDEIHDVARNVQMLISIDDMTPQPGIGWVLDGNRLSPKPLLQQSVAAAIQFGKSLKDDVTARIGARNLILNKSEADIAVLVSQLINIGFVLEGGALKTARGIIQLIKPMHPDHAEELQYAIDRITSYVGE
jgi:hypothetical protein